MRSYYPHSWGYQGEKLGDDFIRLTEQVARCLGTKPKLIWFDRPPCRVLSSSEIEAEYGPQRMGRFEWGLK
jgi:hypothetical protein